VTDGNINNLDAVSEALNVRGNAWAAALKCESGTPAAAVITKKILCRQVCAKKIWNIKSKSEANQYIPFAWRS